jgi:hypothetical protein
MTSKIIVNNIESDTGVSTVTISSPVNLSGGITGSGFSVGTGVSISSPSANILKINAGVANSDAVTIGGGNFLYGVPSNEIYDTNSDVSVGDYWSTQFGSPARGNSGTKFAIGIGNTLSFVGFAHTNTAGKSIISTILESKLVSNVAGSETGEFRILTKPSTSRTLERVKVDSGGRVTMPYQPFVSATKTNGNPSGTDVLIIFNTTDVNIGNHYSTTTGLFTCPVAGAYRITIHGHTEGSSGGNGLSPLKNGTLQNGGSYSQFGSATYVSHISDTILTCAMGDTLSARCRSGTFWGGGPEGVTMTIQLLG